ncbi:hypothetical protein RRU01S_15_00590 [Agrobacterium rubi TR3 = NBRC 13261]|uniref:Uncharacterized protein n=1 Tax=Agrobacterium rubi TR3 = NBRC 13261 TaxID=1368415 RepID=A0A081CWT8_9HYPH|nr:hypothetical protein [Agrobacterium rubi]MBP1878101.1 hypothetical protein [Agrobacterium rubi]GAK71134.1 hypothetical protein RRU01S_15_00590 [Agrobacterium rubi TR3 = NBRC 13261]
MDLTTFNEALGLASSAVGLTGKAASTITAIKGMFEGGKTPDSGEASKLLNELANELTLANMTNVQISQALKALNQELLRQDEFAREKARYELFQTAEGSLVFKLSDAMRNNQPAHFICPVCLNRDRLVSFLQGNGDYRTCQTDHHHVYKFADTPYPNDSGSSYF